MYIFVNIDDMIKVLHIDVLVISPKLTIANRFSIF